MFISKPLISGLIALGLAFTPVGVLAAEPQAHMAAVEIKLDNGKSGRLTKYSGAEWVK